jgi:hypothetical protein
MTVEDLIEVGMPIIASIEAWSVMKHFATTGNVVTVGFEVARKAGDSWKSFVPDNIVGIDPGGARASSREHTGSTWIANRSWNMRIGKQQTALSQSIYVWSLNLRMPTQTTDPVVQIVQHDH